MPRAPRSGAQAWCWCALTAEQEYKFNLLYYQFFFGVLRRYVENGAGASQWVGRDGRNYKSIIFGLTAIRSGDKWFPFKLLQDQARQLLRARLS